MRKFLVLVKKETKELLTPQVLMPLIIMVLLFVFIGKVIGTEAKKAEAKQNISVIDFDSTAISNSVIEILSKSGFKVSLYEKGDVDSVIDETKEKDGTIVMVIPKGFESGLGVSESQDIETYAILKNFSFLGSRDIEAAKVALAAINDFVSNQLILAKAPGVDPQELKVPIKVKEHVIVGDKMAETSPEQVMGFVTSQTTFIPIALFLVIIIAAQMIATAIATEKENKTLETLLSTPVSRNVLVTAKMVAAGLIALLAAIFYMFGFRYYMNEITGGAMGDSASALVSEVMKDLGLVLTPAGYTILGLSLFFGILCALAIAVIIGAFAEDVKSIQVLITPLMIMIMVPYFLTMFLDIGSLSPLVRYVVFAIPFTHPFLAAPNLFLGNYAAVFYGILYEVVFFSIFVYIAGRIFSSDRILTMKFKLKTRKA